MRSRIYPGEVLLEAEYKRRGAPADREVQTIILGGLKEIRPPFLSLAEQGVEALEAALAKPAAAFQPFECARREHGAAESHDKLADYLASLA